MNVGKLRDMVGFYRLVAVDDEAGGFTSAFELIGNYWSKVEQLPGSRQLSSDQIMNVKPYRLTVRTQDVEVEESQLGRYKGRNLVIHSVNTKENRWYDILAYEQKNAGGIATATPGDGGGPVIVIVSPPDGIIPCNYSGFMLLVDASLADKTLVFPDASVCVDFNIWVRRIDLNPDTNVNFTCLGSGVFEEGEGIQLTTKSNIQLKAYQGNYVTVSH